MFGFGKKNKKEDMNVDINSVDLSNSRDMQVSMPRYEYTVKVFDMGDDDKPIVSIQKGIKADSDDALASLYAMCGQKIQILEKREINPPRQIPQQQPNISMDNGSQQVQPVAQAPKELPTKYFSAGGIDFKMVGQEVFQKQWVQATEEECQRIRIVNDSSNKIVSLNGKHLEIQHWIKIDDSIDQP